MSHSLSILADFTSVVAWIVLIFSIIFYSSNLFFWFMGTVEDYDFYPYLPTPPLGQDMTQGQFFKRCLTGLN